MSLRLSVRVFNLKEMQSWFGGNNQDLYKQLIRDMDDWMEPSDDDELGVFREARKRLDSLIKDGLVPSKKKETEGDVAAAYTLALRASANPQPWDDDTEEEEWSWQDLAELSEKINARLDKKTKLLLQYVTEGRPLFGQSFSDDCGWYAYLENSEAIQLNQALTKVYEEASALLTSGNLNKATLDSAVVDVLEHVRATLAKSDATKQDLFIYAS